MPVFEVWEFIDGGAIHTKTDHILLTQEKLGTFCAYT